MASPKIQCQVSPHCAGVSVDTLLTDVESETLVAMMPMVRKVKRVREERASV
jgi:hypothetical protein